ncbi:MAG: hypothetical protein KGN02_07440 [bacterium]|nr:hypothetical protein [bacterium]
MILTTIALVAQAAPKPTASPNAAVMAHAKAWFLALQAGKVLDPSALTDQMRTLLTPSTVAGVAKALAPLGPPTGFTQLSTGTQAGSIYFVYAVTFKTGETWNYVYAVDGTGKISGLRVSPAQ